MPNRARLRNLYLPVDAVNGALRYPGAIQTAPIREGENVAIPIEVALLAAIDVPWLPAGAFVLIALGLMSLGRTVANPTDGQE